MPVLLGRLDVFEGHGAAGRMFAVELYAGISDRARQISCDFDMYKWHHLVETFFCDLKQFRRIPTRHEKTDESYAAMIHLAGTRFALK